MIAALMMTYQCNFHCSHCMVDSSRNFSCVNEEVVQKFIEIVKKLCTQKVYLVGGEVLLHIDLVESIGKNQFDCEDIIKKEKEISEKINYDFYVIGVNDYIFLASILHYCLVVL